MGQMESRRQTARLAPKQSLHKGHVKSSGAPCQRTVVVPQAWMMVTLCSAHLQTLSWLGQQRSRARSATGRPALEIQRGGRRSSGLLCQFVQARGRHSARNLSMRRVQSQGQSGPSSGRKRGRPEMCSRQQERRQPGWRQQQRLPGCLRTEGSLQAMLRGKRPLQRPKVQQPPAL